MSKPQKLPSGNWRIQWFDTTGARRSETFATEALAKAALRHREVEEDKIRAGLARPKSNVKLADAAKEWLDTRSAKRRKDDESRLRTHVLPFLGAYRLAEIGGDVLLRFVRHLEAKRTTRQITRHVDGQIKVETRAGKETLRPMTIKNCLILVCKMLRDLGFPVSIKYKVPTSDYAWIKNPADVGRFLAKCRPGTWFHVAAALGVYAGLRKGEVAGLRRSALDFEHAIICVDRSYDGPVKSKHMRWVPMAPELASILRPWLLQNPGERVVTMNGKPLTEATKVDKRTRNACKRAGVDAVTFHQLRHTAASHLALRVSLPTVGAVLGHIDPKTTARYAHLDSNSLARDAKLHLNFSVPSGTVIQLSTGTAHRMHTEDQRTDEKPKS
jgi:integrase